jgi:Ca2+/Na+ antiporter
MTNSTIDGVCYPGLSNSSATLVSVVIVFYVFYGFYIVTDVFLVPAVQKLCTKMHIPDDVAGAAIMAIALNSPEVFSNVCSLFIIHNKVGLGLIMGSFNFNILVITGATAIFSRQTLRSRQLQLEWRYLQRDAGFYCISICLLLWAASDSELTLLECSTLLGT